MENTGGENYQNETVHGGWNGGAYRWATRSNPAFHFKLRYVTPRIMRARARTNPYLKSFGGSPSGLNRSIPPAITMTGL